MHFTKEEITAFTKIATYSNWTLTHINPIQLDTPIKIDIVAPNGEWIWSGLYIKPKKAKNE